MLNNHFASDLITQFFNRLSKEKLRYAVLRNYELLPDDNDSKDVDLVVAPKDFKNTVSIAKEVAKENGYKLIWKNELDYLDGLVFVKVSESNIYSIKLDIFNGFKWRGCSYIDYNIILNSTVDYNGIKVALGAHESYIMIVYYVLYAKKIRKKYLKPIYQKATKNIDDFKLIVRTSFIKSTSDEIITMVQYNRINELVTLRRRMINNIVKNSFKQEPIFTNFLKHIKTEYMDRNSMGTMIAFSGPDGAGKSTLVDVVMELFSSLGITSRDTPHHFLTTNIPSLHKLPGAPEKDAKQDYTKPYQAKTAGTISSIVRTVYYYFAFLFDRLIYVKKELRANHIVVFDRYYTDMIIDPTRIRIGIKKSLIQKLFKTLPAPDYTFVVLADKDMILSRKDELKEDKLVELLEEYTSLPKIISNSKVLYNNVSIHEGKLMLCQNVFNMLEKRYN